MDKKLKQLIDIDKSGKMNEVFEKSLTNILKENPPIERVRLEGVRYANIANEKKQDIKSPPLGESLSELMQAQKKDLGLLRSQLDETIKEFRAAFSSAENGKFAVLMLSGRVGFADKIQQSVDLVETYARFYSRSCMTTIAATMQAYPAGLEWLEGTSMKRSKQSAGKEK